jgi:hypothetical protein
MAALTRARGRNAMFDPSTASASAASKETRNAAPSCRSCGIRKLRNSTEEIMTLTLNTGAVCSATPSGMATS